MSESELKMVSGTPLTIEKLKRETRLLGLKLLGLLPIDTNKDSDGYTRQMAAFIAIIIIRLIRGRDWIPQLIMFDFVYGADHFEVVINVRQQ